MDKTPLKVLVIEDNRGDLLLLTEYLEEEFVNLEIIEAHTAKEAAQKLETETGIDVILLDLSLPDAHGEDLVRNILNQAERIPVVVLTGYTDKSFAIKSIGLGTSDYLVKDELNTASLYKSIIYSRERSKATNQLKESEKRYRELFHLSPMSMWVFDLETLAFLDVNDAAITHYGYTMEEFLGMTIRCIRPAEDIPLLEKAIAAIRLNNQNLLPGIFMHKKKNGEIIQVEIQSNPIIFNGKRAEIILARDITERLAYTSAIETQNNRLKEIAWIQSHVVRAPLSRLLGLVDAIQMDENPDKELTELLGYIKNSAEELDEIVRKINKKTELIDPIEFNGNK